jgi:hypothetical protein
MRRLSLSLMFVACHPAPALDLPICPALVTASRAAEADTRVLPPDVWFALLVPGFDRQAGAPPEDPRDCSQRAIVTDEDPPLPARPRTADDLSFGTSDDGAALVWARLLDYPDGTAVGPVVLARWVPQGLEIRGVGSLRAPARRARLRLERLQDGHPLLLAEGEACPVDPACTTCPPGQVPCPREAVLLPLVDQRFLAADIIEGEHAPRPARLRLDERRELPRPGGRTRRLEIRRRIDLRGAAPALHAAIRIRDCVPGLPCDDHLTLVDARPLALAGLTFVTAEDPWYALLNQQSLEQTAQPNTSSRRSMR